MRSCYLIMMVALLAGCTNKKKVPDIIIPQEKMEKLIWDVMMVDEYAKESVLSDTSKNVKKERSVLFQQVFNLHNTSREAFIRSYKYYLSRPDLTKVMFDTLATRGNRKREEAFRLVKPVK